jgi:hypothetical protein
MPEDIYWQKYSARFKSFPSLLPEEDTKADMAICIPVFAEADLILTLDSLWHCELPPGLVEVLVCFNKNEEITENELFVHGDVWQKGNAWVEKHQKDGLRFRLIYIDRLPNPKGGVGWARKMVMDEAARRMEQDSIIICLDGDCLVEKNYLKEVSHYFSTHPECDAGSIHYEHQLVTLAGEERNAIIEYELHLRYLVHALRWAGHPFAFQTVGSSMAVRRSAYLSHGGMNTRKAGEDFYFLQKFIEIGSLQEISSTTVYPSARISYRVPFGTGRAMSQLLSSQNGWVTTSMDIYKQLKFLISQIPRIGKICLGDHSDKEALIKNLFASYPEMSAYLGGIDFFGECIRISAQTASPASFQKRFFRYFNAFRVIRFSHELRDRIFPDVPVLEAVQELIVKMEMPTADLRTTEDYLLFMRKLDKEEV